jgi:hypothetical protein
MSRKYAEIEEPAVPLFTTTRHNSTCECSMCWSRNRFQADVVSSEPVELSEYALKEQLKATRNLQNLNILSGQ